MIIDPSWINTPVQDPLRCSLHDQDVTRGIFLRFMDGELTKKKKKKKHKEKTRMKEVRAETGGRRNINFWLNLIWSVRDDVDVTQQLLWMIHFPIPRSICQGPGVKCQDINCASKKCVALKAVSMSNKYQKNKLAFCIYVFFHTEN